MGKAITKLEADLIRTFLTQFDMNRPKRIDALAFKQVD
jgi:hypothetical protein